jgi:hypothetical protein
MPAMNRHLLGLGLAAAAGLALPWALSLRLRPASQPLTECWQSVPVAPRRSTLLGISFRPTQLEALGLPVRPSLDALLAYPFSLIRLGAYWNRSEPSPGEFDPAELDDLVETAARAGKQIILAVGAVKNFSYPEFYVPTHRLAQPLLEHRLVTPASHPALQAAASEFVTRLVERYRRQPAIVAWQVEHEALDPLGLEHSWRLSTAFLAQEVAAVRRADPTRPIVLNGFFPNVLPGRLALWWQTRDQGDSLAAAGRLADIVGVDDYPRYAVAPIGNRTLYFDGTVSPWAHHWRRGCLTRARRPGQRLMVAEGQAEPWEAVTPAPDPPKRAMASGRPEHLIQNYNAWLGDAADDSLWAYLFWGAEYWLLRQRSGDPRYLRAFARVLTEA